MSEARPICLTAITLNTALDCLTILGRCDLGEVNRSEELRVVPGGKGVNVAKAARLLGAPVVAGGFVGAGPLGQHLQEGLAGRGVECQFVPVPGDSRPTYVLCETESPRETVINNPALYQIGAGDYDALCARLTEQAGRSAFVVLAGSLPAGIPATAYAALGRIAQQAGARVVLDSSGEAFRRGLRASPFLVKPTVRELEAHLRRVCSTDEDIWAGAKALRTRGVELVVVTRGADGAWALHHGARYRVHTAAVPVRSALGSGDAMVAGLCVALWEGRSIPEALAWGAAAGTSSVTRYGGGECRLEEVQELAARVIVEQL